MIAYPFCLSLSLKSGKNFLSRSFSIIFTCDFRTLSDSFLYSLYKIHSFLYNKHKSINHLQHLLSLSSLSLRKFICSIHYHFCHYHKKTSKYFWGKRLFENRFSGYGEFFIFHCNTVASYMCKDSGYCLFRFSFSTTKIW